MANIIDTRYPKGKVETMEINSYSSEKFLKDMVETLTLLSPNDLGKLKDAVAEEVEKRKSQRFIELQENAIRALNDYFQVGGCIVNNKNNYNFGIDEELMSVGERDCIYLR